MAGGLTEVSFFPRSDKGVVSSNPILGFLFTTPVPKGLGDLGGWVVHQVRYLHPDYPNVELYPWSVSHYGEGFRLCWMAERTPFDARKKASLIIGENYEQLLKKVAEFELEREQGGKN